MEIVNGKSNQEKKNFFTKDIFEIRNLSGVKLSPDGSNIVCATTIPDLNKNTRVDYITLISTKDKQVNILTEGASPLWSPDGLWIAYHSSEKGQSGIWIYNFKNSKKRFLSAVYHSAYFINHLAENNFSWSPDGRYIAYVSTSPFSELRGHLDPMATQLLLDVFSHELHPTTGSGRSQELDRIQINVNARTRR